ncbi:MAG: transposase [Deltaproteobacteria bacterium]|jgi:hypothetical protein|nr:transposase [Deltaproteobacteria bacterium]
MIPSHIDRSQEYKRGPSDHTRIPQRRRHTDGGTKEKTTFEASFDSVVGVDVHSQVNVACYFEPDSSDDYIHEHKEFSTLPHGLRALADWAISKGTKAVIMENTGVYWKTLHAALVKASLKVVVVNPRHAKNLPGLKIDMSDSLWLAKLSCFGLLRASFVPCPEIENMHGISRLIQKMTQDLASSKNRVTKWLVEHGVRLVVVVSDVFGKSARAVLDAIADGEPPAEAVRRVTTRLKATPDGDPPGPWRPNWTTAHGTSSGGSSAAWTGTRGRSPSWMTISWTPSRITPGTWTASRRYPG